MNRTEEFATGNGQWHGMDKPTDTKHYGRGWKAERSSDDALERGDNRGENKAWYDGYHDSAVGRPKSYEDPHPRELEHGGPVPYLSHLERDIRRNGLQTPVRIRNENVVEEGNHRAAVILRMGMDPVPVEHVR